MSPKVDHTKVVGALADTIRELNVPATAAPCERERSAGRGVLETREQSGGAAAAANAASTRAGGSEARKKKVL